MYENHLVQRFGAIPYIAFGFSEDWVSINDLYDTLHKLSKRPYVNNQIEITANFDNLSEAIEQNNKANEEIKIAVEKIESSAEVEELSEQELALKLMEEWNNRLTR